MTSQSHGLSAFFAALRLCVLALSIAINSCNAGDDSWRLEFCKSLNFEISNLQFGFRVSRFAIFLRARLMGRGWKPWLWMGMAR